MLIEATTRPLKFHLRDGSEIRLVPGQPVDLPDGSARKLLEKAKGKVRLVPPAPTPSTAGPVVIEPAAPNARPVFWQRGTGEIVGPAKPEFLVKVGDGPKASFWVVAEYRGVPIWVQADRLRSKQAFEQQTKPQVIEAIREPFPAKKRI